jgi:hypothetical protein
MTAQSMNSEHHRKDPDGLRTQCCVLGLGFILMSQLRSVVVTLEYLFSAPFALYISFIQVVGGTSVSASLHVVRFNLLSVLTLISNPCHSLQEIPGE